MGLIGDKIMWCYIVGVFLIGILAGIYLDILINKGD